MSNNCIYVDEGESFSVWEDTTRKASKSWTCCECGDEIKSGSTYEYFRGLFDGSWDTYRTCARCALVAADFFRGRMLGCMVEDFQAEHGFDYRDGIPADFTPCGKDAVTPEDE